MHRTKTIYVPLFILSMLVLQVLSCTDRIKSAEESAENQAIDSISSWIKNAKNKSLEPDKRFELLKKAYAETNQIENDSIKLDFFSELSLTSSTLGNLSLFRRTNAQLMKLAALLGDSLKQAEAHWDLAYHFNNSGVVDSTYYHYSKAHKIYSNLGKGLETGKMLYNMAVSQSQAKDYTGSEINTIRAIELLKPLDAYRQLYNCYNNLGSVTKELKEYERALEYYNIALQYQKKIKKENSFNLSLKNNIGGVYQEQGKYEKAIPYFEEVLGNNSIFEKRPKLYAMALNNLSFCKLKLDKKEGLAQNFRKAIRIQDSIGDISRMSLSYFSLAELHLAEKDTLQALTHAKQALKYAKQVSNNERLLETLQLLIRLEPDKSMAYNNAYITLSDSLQQIERRMRNKFERIRFETDEFIAENVMLAREKQLWAGIAVAVLLLGLMYYFILDQRAKNQKLRFQQAQQAANQEIFDLMLAQNEKIELGKKMEQKRISEELHDGVLGRMLGARMVLTGLNKKSDSEAEMQRKKAIDALQDVEKEVRAISHELSHAAYQKIHNFIHSLEDLLESVQIAGNFEYVFNYNEEFDWDGLNGEIKINVYRLIQESLQNCVKHAQNEKVMVDLKISDNDLTIVVKDDGKGFKKTTGKKGIGMRNISSRVKKLDGEWKIESTIGKGTTVTLVIPLNSNQDKKNKVDTLKPFLKEV